MANRNWLQRIELPTPVTARQYLVFGQYGVFQVHADQVEAINQLPADTGVILFGKNGGEAPEDVDWTVVGTVIENKE